MIYRPAIDAQRDDIRNLMIKMADSISTQLSLKEAEGIIECQESFVEEIKLAFYSAVKRINATPANDEWFELELNEPDESKVITNEQNYDIKGWKYLGPRLQGKERLIAKLTCLGKVCSIKEAEEKAGRMGYRLLEGQFRKAFVGKFPKPDGRSRIIFGGSQWQDSEGNVHVACLAYHWWIEWQYWLGQSDSNFGSAG